MLTPRKPVVRKDGGSSNLLLGAMRAWGKSQPSSPPSWRCGCNSRRSHHFRRKRNYTQSYNTNLLPPCQSSKRGGFKIHWRSPCGGAIPPGGTIRGGGPNGRLRGLEPRGSGSTPDRPTTAGTYGTICRHTRHSRDGRIWGL